MIMSVRRKRNRGAGSKEPESQQPRSEPWRVEEVINARGEPIVRKFVEALEGVNCDEAKALLKVLAERGNELGMPESKGLGQGLFELRGSEVRIFYCFRPGRRIVLMDAMLKKRMDIPDGVFGRLRKLARRIE